MNWIAVPRALDAMLADIDDAVRSGNVAQDPRPVATLLQWYVTTPALLRGIDLSPSPERYARHLLAEDRYGQYAVAALVWRPGQMSRVHGHRTWCALGVQRGVLTEMTYTPSACPDEPPQARAATLRRPGDVSCGPAGTGLIHRIANLGTCDAISVHVYGVPFERFATGVNEIFAD